MTFPNTDKRRNLDRPGDFVLIANPGMDNEHRACWTSYGSKVEALKALADLIEIEALLSNRDFDEVEAEFDIMMIVDNDGTLTTEH